MRRTYAVRRPVLNAYLVRQRDRRRMYELALVVLVTLPLAAALIGYVWLHLELLQTGYEVHRLERRLEVAHQQERALGLRASFLTRQADLERRAVEELGMQMRSAEQMVVVVEKR